MPPLHSRIWLFGMLVVVGASALGGLHLRTQFEPEELVAHVESLARPADFEEPPLPQPESVLVVVEAVDVLESEVLTYAETLAEHYRDDPRVGDVTSLGRVRVPHIRAAEQGGLAELEAGMQEQDSPVVAPALEDLVASSPEYFPRGVVDVLDRVGGEMSLAPIVRGASPTAAEVGLMRGVLQESETLRRAFVGESSRHLILRVEVDGRLDAGGERQLVEALQEGAGAVAPPEGVQVHVAGLPALRVSLEQDLAEDSLWLILLALVANLAILLLAFRRFGTAILPLSAAGLSILAVLGAMGWLGVPLDLLTTIVPPLLITVVVADAVHFLCRHQEEQKRSEAGRALNESLKRVGLACLVTSATTSLGFASLMVADTAALQRMGLTAALGVWAAFGIIMVLMAAGLSRAEPDTSPRREDRWGERFGDWARASNRRPWWPVMAALGVALGALVLGMNVRTDAGLLEQFAPEHPARAVAEQVDVELGGIRHLELTLGGLDGNRIGAGEGRAVHELVSWLRAQPGVGQVRSFTDPVVEMWGRLSEADPSLVWESEARFDALQRMLRDEARGEAASEPARVRIDIHLHDAEARAHLELVQGLQGRLMETELAWHLGGEALRAAVGLRSLSAELVSSLGLAVGLVFLVLVLLFRSLRLGLLSLPPNLLPLGVVLGWMSLRDIPVHASTVMVFAVSFGLVVDGTIHMVVRFREELAAGYGPATSAVRMVRFTGRAVWWGSLTILAGFSTLFISDFQPIRHFAELSCVAIVTSLAAELFLLPPLLALFGQRRGGGRG